MTNTPASQNASASTLTVPIMQKVDYDALADRCLALLQGKQKASSKSKRNNEPTPTPTPTQVFVGIAGTPGSGKSFIAKQVRDKIAERTDESTSSNVMVIGMDGYHLKRQQLQDMAERGETFKTDHNGKVQYKKLTYQQLLARRGAGFTYCPRNFVEDLRKVKQEGHGSFPVYDREQHDPVPNGVQVQKHHEIILVEGLYLLCLHDPDWEPLEELWDDKWYIDVSMEETKQRLIKRHLKYWNDDKTERWGGNDAEAAARKAESNDMINAECIRRMSRDKANLIIRNENIPENDNDNADVKAASECKQ